MQPFAETALHANLPHATRKDGLELRVLGATDLPALQALRAVVLANLPDSDLYRAEVDELGFIAAHLGGSQQPSPGQTIGVFDSHNADKLVAYAMLGYPDIAKAHSFAKPLAHALELTFDDNGCIDESGVAQLASCMVLPAYQGRGLQRLLSSARFGLAQSQGRHLCIAMASLRHSVSRRNLMGHGLKVAWVGEIDGLRRHVLAANLTKSWDFDLQSAQWVDTLDYDQQVALNRQGFWGVGEIHKGATNTASRLVFARKN